MTTSEFNIIYRAHYNNLLRYTAKLLGGSCAAEDIVQLVFMRLWSDPPEDKSGITNWLFKCAKNAAYNHLKRGSRFTYHNPELDLEEMVIRYLVHREMQEYVRKLIASIKADRKRQILTLFYIDGLTDGEISRELGIARSSVNESKRLGLMYLKRMLFNNQTK